MTTLGKKKELQKILEVEKAFAVVTPDSSLNTPVRIFDSKFNKKSMVSLLKYTHFLNIPELYRFSFLDYCEYS